MRYLSPLLIAACISASNCLAGITEDQDAVRDITFCFDNVYTAEPYKYYVYQIDIDNLNRIDQKLRNHLQKTYSPEDSGKIILVGWTQGDTMKPKPSISPVEVVKACRAVVERIGQRY